MSSWLRREAEGQMPLPLSQSDADHLENFGLRVLAEVERLLKDRAPSDRVDAVLSVTETCRLVRSLRESRE